MAESTKERRTRTIGVPVWIALIGAVGVIAAAIISRNSSSLQPSVTNTGSGAAFIGNNNNVKYEIAPDGSSDTQEILNSVRRMELVQKERVAELEKRFPLGYMLFTATDRRQIVPMKTNNVDDMLRFNWKSESHAVRVTSSNIFLHLPVFQMGLNSQSGLSTFPGQDWMLPRTEGVELKNTQMGDILLSFYIVSTNDPGAIIALGLKSGVPRPPLKF